MEKWRGLLRRNPDHRISKSPKPLLISKSESPGSDWIGLFFGSAISKYQQRHCIEEKQPFIRIFHIGEFRQINLKEA